MSIISAITGFFAGMYIVDVLYKVRFRSNPFANKKLVLHSNYIYDPNYSTKQLKEIVDKLE